MNILKQGDTIGIICPSCVADKNDYEKYKSGIDKLGFKVKLGKNIYKDTNRYTASVEERVNDLNEMVYDENVKMILFDGGCGSVGFHGNMLSAVIYPTRISQNQQQNFVTLCKILLLYSREVRFSFLFGVGARLCDMYRPGIGKSQRSSV